MSDYVEVAERTQNFIQRVSLTAGEMGEIARQSGVKEVIKAWGAWARDQPHIGYPKKAAGMGQNPIPSGEKFDACTDEEAAVVEKAMLLLRSQYEDEYAIVFAKYVLWVPFQAIANYMGESKRGVELKLQRAEYFLMGVLAGMESTFKA
jgi:Phage antitermination protein Q.